jgi:hypothetical protein
MELENVLAGGVGVYQPRYLLAFFHLSTLRWLKHLGTSRLDCSEMHFPSAITFLSMTMKDLLGPDRSPQL